MPNFSGLWTERQQMQAAGASTWPAFPGAPTIGTATAGSGSASVAFTAPSYTGYPAGITSYTATSSPGGFTGTGASSPITVSGLTNGTAYTFTVTATNATGTGPASAASNSVTPSVNYIEDVFSTYLYTGNGSTQTITNNIDLSTKGGLVWCKDRTIGLNHALFDTARGVENMLQTDNNGAQSAQTGSVTAFNTNGFTVGSNIYVNNNTTPYVSWTFRKQPKFFDVVTWSGDSTSGRQIAHNLGATPGMVMIKSLVVDNWCVWHRSLTAGRYIVLNSTAAQTTSGAVNRYGNGTTTVDPTSTYVTVGSNGEVNQTGNNYVAYLFAHDAGGFGLTGTDNVISCGSFSGSGTQTINLGWEPQWVMVKNSVTAGGSWYIADNMRGLPASTSATTNYLKAESSGAEVTYTNDLLINSTGFTTPGFSTQTCIYIAIRRGPMKVPTDATTVYKGITRSGTGANASITTVGFPPDALLGGIRTPGGWNFTSFQDKLRGPNYSLQSGDQGAEFAPASISVSAFGQTGYSVGPDAGITNFNASGGTYITECLKRAPQFFDVVCYTGNSASSGTGNTQLITHNLGVAPEMIIVKRRSGSSDWIIWTSALSATQYMFFDAGAVLSANPTFFFGTTGPTPSSTQFKVGDAYYTNASGNTYVAYLFATCAGVSKVGSYTGTGTLTTIDCGFTGGARYVLIKRKDSSSDWFYWDTARGMTAGTDPSLALNNTNAESNANSVYTITTGFQLLASPSADVNTNGGSYIYLAIA